MSAAANTRAIGIVVALLSEARALTSLEVLPERLTSISDGAIVYTCGMGAVAAAHAADALADAGVGALAVFGVAGALDSELAGGALFCPDCVIDENGHSYVPDVDWRARILERCNAKAVSIRSNGCLLSVTAPLLTTASKLAARTRFSAIIVDMESAAVGAVAKRRNLPFLVLRAVVDELGDTIPAALNDSIDAWGRAKLHRLAAAIIRQPSLVAELPHLYSRMKQATKSLTTASHAVGPELAWHQ